MFMFAVLPMFFDLGLRVWRTAVAGEVRGRMQP
jgi:hypothetical protein